MSSSFGMNQDDDPWSWGVEDNSDGQLSITTASQQQPHHNKPNEVSYDKRRQVDENQMDFPSHQQFKSSSSNIGMMNNNMKQSFEGGGGGTLTNKYNNSIHQHPPAQQYRLFNNRNNNNSMTDVENKEIVPPDFNSYSSNHQIGGRVINSSVGNNDLSKSQDKSAAPYPGRNNLSSTSNIWQENQSGLTNERWPTETKTTQDVRRDNNYYQDGDYYKKQGKEDFNQSETRIHQDDVPMIKNFHSSFSNHSLPPPPHPTTVNLFSSHSDATIKEFSSTNKPMDLSTSYRQMDNTAPTPAPHQHMFDPSVVGQSNSFKQDMKMMAPPTNNSDEPKSLPPLSSSSNLMGSVTTPASQQQPSSLPHDNSHFERRPPLPHTSVDPPVPSKQPFGPNYQMQLNSFQNPCDNQQNQLSSQPDWFMQQQRAAPHVGHDGPLQARSSSGEPALPSLHSNPQPYNDPELQQRLSDNSSTHQGSNSEGVGTSNQPRFQENESRLPYSLFEITGETNRIDTSSMAPLNNQSVQQSQSLTHQTPYEMSTMKSSQSQNSKSTYSSLPIIEDSNLQQKQEEIGERGQQVMEMNQQQKQQMMLHQQRERDLSQQALSTNQPVGGNQFLIGQPTSRQFQPSSDNNWPEAGKTNTVYQTGDESIGHQPSSVPMLNSMNNSSIGYRETVSPPTDVMPSRGQAAGQDHPDNQETLNDSAGAISSYHQPSVGEDNTSCPSDRNVYLESSHLSSQIREMRISSPDDSTSQAMKDVGRNEREVVGEADQPRRVVLGQGGSGANSSAPPPPLLPSSSSTHVINSSRLSPDERRGSMERMVVGERRDDGPDNSADDSSRQRVAPAPSSALAANSRHSRQQLQHNRESSFDEDEHDYPSDRDRRAGGYRRDERHRRRRDHGSSEYMSDEDYEYERRPTYRRERRIRDYSPEYRRDYYRDEPRRTRREYYNRDYEEDNYYKDRSRPSSRSGSDYRRTNAEYQARGSRQNYYHHSNTIGGAGAAGYGGMRGEYEYNQEYYEMLRRNHPAFYAMWYQEYLNKMASAAAVNQSYSNDRASVHSGQSTNNRVTTPNAGLESNVNAESFDDYSPRLFSTAHTRGNFDNQGRLVIVDAHYPMDGQMASLQLCSVEPPHSLEPNVKEFLETPGPFIPGVTHRSTVLQYLKKMSEQAKDSSEKLLYDLVHLTVKSNGNPNASDISELLLDSYKKSKEGVRDEWDQEIIDEPISHGQMVNRFRELLLQGNKTEALEWAMDHGGWGHALFLASKMDRRTHNNVMLQFANSLPPNDPLQTLYQLMSNHVPQAATSCGDEKWSDWRPHLAMILSNSTENPDIDRKAIITLGDTLSSRGKTHGAHLCYLIGQVGFSDYSTDAKLVLLGTSANQPFEQFFNYRSVLLTLCYEYGIKQGAPQFSIPSLQSYKVLLASRLVDWGRSRSALQYCELTASEILANGQTSPDVVNILIDLSSKLKMLDPQLALSRDTSLDPDWLEKLKQFLVNLVDENGEPLNHHQQEPLQFEGNNDVYNYGSSARDDLKRNDNLNEERQVIDGGGGISWQQQPQLHHGELPINPSSAAPLDYLSSMKGNQQVQHQQPQPPINHELSVEPHSQSVFHPPSYSTPTHQQINGYQQAEHRINDTSNQWAPDSGLPAAAPSSNLPSLSFYQASEQQLQAPVGVGQNVESTENLAATTTTTTNKGAIESGPNDNNNKKKKVDGGKSSGWFGGFWDKLTPKPKNQMVLPDDTDPKIVFDPKLKRWVDREGDDSEKSVSLKPPPMMVSSSQVVTNLAASGGGPSSIPPSLSQQPQLLMSSSNINTAATTGGNKYKLQKGKSMKSNYVDVLGGSRSSNKSEVNSLQPLVPPPPNHTTNQNFFIPAPVDGQDHLPQSIDEQVKNQDVNSQSVAAPVMYNPANFN